MPKSKQMMSIALLILLLGGCASISETPQTNSESSAKTLESEASDLAPEEPDEVEAIETSEAQNLLYLEISPEELGDKLTCGSLLEQVVADGITGYSCFLREEGPFTVFFEGESFDAVAEWVKSGDLEFWSDAVLVTFGKMALFIPSLDDHSLKVMDEIGVEKLVEIEPGLWYSVEP